MKVDATINSALKRTQESCESLTATMTFRCFFSDHTMSTGRNNPGQLLKVTGLSSWLYRLQPCREPIRSPGRNGFGPPLNPI